MSKEEVFELVLRIYLDYLRDTDQYGDWLKGHVVWVGVRTLWEHGRRKGMLPRDMGFNEFWEMVRRLHGYAGRVVVEVHPLYWDKPEIGAAIAIWKS